MQNFFRAPLSSTNKRTRSFVFERVCSSVSRRYESYRQCYSSRLSALLWTTTIWSSSVVYSCRCHSRHRCRLRRSGPGRPRQNHGWSGDGRRSCNGRGPWRKNSKCDGCAEAPMWWSCEEGLLSSDCSDSCFLLLVVYPFHLILVQLSSSFSSFWWNLRKNAINAPIKYYKYPVLCCCLLTMHNFYTCNSRAPFPWNLHGPSFQRDAPANLLAQWYALSGPSD